MRVSLANRVILLFSRIMITHRSIDHVCMRYVVMPFDGLFVLALCTSDEDRSSLTFSQSLV